MSYQTLVVNEVKEAQYLAVLKPRIRFKSFTSEGGGTYSVAMSYTEFVNSVGVDGTALGSVNSLPLTPGQFYFSDTEKKLYVRASDSGNVNSKLVIAIFEIYVGTFDAHTNRIPTDESTKEVYFEPLITKSPSIESAVDEILFGFLPIQSTSMELSNTEHLLEPILHECSFNGCTIELYHWLSTRGEVVPTNMKLVMRGIGSDFTYSTETISIVIKDRVDIFNKEWRNETDSFYSKALFPLVDPNFIGRPIRYIFGKVRGFIPVNVSYVSDDPQTTDNREHLISSEIDDLAEKTFTVAVSPSSTTTRTYLTSTPTGLMKEDTVKLDGSTDYYVEIKDVNYVSNYIEHEAIAAPMNSGETVRKGFVSRVEIVQSGIRYLLMYLRDYTCSINIQGTGLAGIVLDANLETTLLMENTLSPTDKIFCTVYGRGNLTSLGGSPFGANDSEVGSLTDPVVILYKILKERVGISESEINLQSFIDLLSDIGGSSVGFAIPEKSSNDFPTHKKIIIDLLQTMLVSIFLDNDLKWKVSRIKPTESTSDDEIASDEIAEDSFSVDYNYEDVLSDVIVEYDSRETTSDSNGGDSTEKVTAESQVAKYLHGVSKQKTFSSLHIKEAEAQSLCDTLSLIFGERDAKYSFSAYSRFYMTLLADRFLVTRDKLPGFNYNEGTVHSRYLVVTSIQKDLGRVTIRLTDQKGIEEN